jgi:hypothetical protein
VAIVEDDLVDQLTVAHLSLADGRRSDPGSRWKMTAAIVGEVILPGMELRDGWDGRKVAGSDVHGE